MKCTTVMLLGLGFLSVSAASVVFAANAPATAPISASAPAAPKVATSNSFSSEEDKISYTLGADMGMNFKNNMIQVNPDVLFQGLKDGMGSAPLKMARPEMEATLVAFQKDLQAKRMTAFKKMSEQNKMEGEKFLSDNKANKDVTALPDGLQYKVITEGKGGKPSVQDVVTVNYEGRFINGQVFDSSYKRGTPATFPLSQVIAAWQKVLPLMPTGSSWEVYVPASLAYGQEGAGGVVGPNQTLIFKIELLSVKKSEPGDKQKKA